MRPVLACCCVASLVGCRGPVAAAPPPAAEPAALLQLPAPSDPPAAGGGPVTPAAEPPDGPIDLDLRVLARTAGGERLITSGETLRSGDQLALYVKVSQPAYVVVGLAGPDGKGSVLAGEGTAPLAPGVEHRIPAPRRWLRLDRTTGREDVFVYASRTPLSTEQSLELLRADTARAKPAGGAVRRGGPPARRAASADAPGTLTAETRALVLEQEGGAEIRAEHGLTRAHVVIQHAR